MSQDVMTKDPLTIDRAPLGTAMEVMRAKAVRHLPVVDDTGTLVGIITDRDLRHAAFSPALAEHLSLWAERRLRTLAHALEDLRVKDAMSWGVATAHPEASVAHAALVMYERRVGSLPVVQDGKLVGIVTERDLLKALAKQYPAVRFDLEGSVVKGRPARTHGWPRLATRWRRGRAVHRRGHSRGGVVVAAPSRGGSGRRSPAPMRAAHRPSPRSPSERSTRTGGPNRPQIARSASARTMWKGSRRVGAGIGGYGRYAAVPRQRTTCRGARLLVDDGLPPGSR